MIQPCIKMIQRAYQKRRWSVSKATTNTRDYTETSSETTRNSATDVTQVQFNQWWNLYDKKLDKKKAFSLFKSALKKHKFETIMNGTQAYLKTITNKQYQKYPKTFLSQESFLNDYSEEIDKTQINILKHLKELHNLIWKIYRFKGVISCKHLKI